MSPRVRCLIRAGGRRDRGFSLIELVMVIAIIALVSAIAIPRLSRAGESARENTLANQLKELNSAAERFSVEHQGLSLAEDTDGSIIDTDRIVKRLTATSNADATGDGIYGPYLRDIPTNPLMGSNAIRVSTTRIHTGQAGWIFVVGINQFFTDGVAPRGIGGGLIGPGAPPPVQNSPVEIPVRLN